MLIYSDYWVYCELERDLQPSIELSLEKMTQHATSNNCLRNKFLLYFKRAQQEREILLPSDGATDLKLSFA